MVVYSKTKCNGIDKEKPEPDSVEERSAKETRAEDNKGAVAWTFAQTRFLVMTARK